jgi:hypothetical protein
MEPDRTQELSRPELLRLFEVSQSEVAALRAELDRERAAFRARIAQLELAPAQAAYVPPQNGLRQSSRTLVPRARPRGRMRGLARAIVALGHG